MELRNRPIMPFAACACVGLLLLACSPDNDQPRDSATATPPADATAIRDLDVGKVAEIQTALRQLGSASLDPDEVTYADVTGDQREEAIVPLSSQGTLGNVAYVVLTLRSGSPAAILMRTPDRSNAGGLVVNVNDGRLVETVPEYGPEDPLCCPSTLRRTYFRWDGNRLQVDREEKVQQPKGPKS